MMPEWKDIPTKVRVDGGAALPVMLSAAERGWGSLRRVNGHTWRTVAVLVSVTLLFVLFGLAFGGPWGLLIFAIIAIGWVGYSFWFSDRLVRSQMGAVAVTETEAPELCAAVERAANQFGVPMPAVYIVESPIPNAFATGRDPHHAAVAATTGLLSVLNERELYGVVSHEMAHIRNRDTMWSCMIAAMCWGVMLTMKPMLWISQAMAWFGGLLVALSVIGRWGFVGTILALVAGFYGYLARIMALAVNRLVDFLVRLLQAAATRQREYFADDVGGRVGGDPNGLASALAKIEQVAKAPDLEEAVAAMTASRVANHLFISNPLSNLSWGLLATHPATNDRIARLELVRQELGLDPEASADQQPATDEIDGGDLS